MTRGASVFFGYASKPNLRRETVEQAAGEIARRAGVEACPWETLRIGGQLIITSILSAIDQSAAAVFDVSELNENVLFELGYAIGKEKRLWLIRDRTISDHAKRRWERVGLLQTIGYIPYQNSDDIAAAFVRDHPHLQSATVFSQLIESALHPAPDVSVVYVASLYNTNPSRSITRRLERERSASFQLLTIDPQESAVQPLPWYAQAFYNSRAFVANLSSTSRQDGDIHNARCALLAGLAQGMGKRVLMLAEEGYATPVDYQDLMFLYDSERGGVGRLGAWLDQHRDAIATPPEAAPPAALRAAAELHSLRLGSHIAEDEATTIADYFVETRAYLEALEPSVKLFVGRKGSGKSANAIRVRDQLTGDARTLTCPIKPAGYELDGLVSLLRRYEERDAKGYLIESLWKFLLYSEIARVASEHVLTRPGSLVPGSPEWELVEAVDQSGQLLQADFSVRLEQAVDDLLTLDVDTGLAIGRVAIAEALHEGIIRRLASLLGRALSGKHRVAILVDNLDKAWERNADFPHLTQLLRGLLGTMRPVAQEFSQRGPGRQPVSVSLAVFLRTDIYGHLVRAEREPDKLPVSHIDWSDSSLLLRVIEERYAAARGGDGRDIWTRLFCATVGARPTREWILENVLHRPRDLLFLVNAAITNAVNRRHQQVGAEDLKDAVLQYSRYAVDSVIVEGEQDVPELEQVLYEFAAAPRFMHEDDVLVRIGRAVPKKDDASAVLEHLRALSVVGIEIGGGEFDFSEDGKARARANAIARNRSRDSGRPLRLTVHPAFRPFLEI